jgi:hypothetical protein
MSTRGTGVGPVIKKKKKFKVMGVESAKKNGIWVVRTSGVRPDELTTQR